MKRPRLARQSQKRNAMQIRHISHRALLSTAVLSKDMSRHLRSAIPRKLSCEHKCTFQQPSLPALTQIDQDESRDSKRGW